MLETKDRLLECGDILRLTQVSETVFWLWVRMGLLPSCQPYKREVVRFHKRFFYPAETLELCKKIRDWRLAGISYREIRARLAEEAKQ